MKDVESPGGYEPYRRYPVGGMSVDFAAIGIALLLWQGLGIESLFGDLAVAELIAVLFVAGPVVVAHEGTHYLAGRAQGLTPTVHWGLPTPYAVPLRQHVRRGQNLVVLLAPTVVLSGGALVVGSQVASPLVQSVCGFVVLVNTACAAGDLVGAVWLAWQPPGTVVYLDTAQEGAHELYARPESRRE
ncbi:DUF3267 domain-containing protein [Halomarina oriensis]|uniref:DUF3267 domain-containing protein n=1 Tax=Halomarina oriensis TaxID=671145 RepID=A0A6B0GJA3_9EURY|nr:DUF3267 domain-containing protein [Halomarina oriensis]MWG33519.1 hypothetical protein [Halomarina oriensis]